VFRSPGHPAEAVIGGIPLFMHAVFAALGLYLLQQRLPTRRKLIFYAVYLFVVVNLTD
jgi:xanthine/uracil permease